MDNEYINEGYRESFYVKEAVEIAWLPCESVVLPKATVIFGIHSCKVPTEKDRHKPDSIPNFQPTKMKAK